MDDGLTVGLRNLGGFAGFLWGVSLASADPEISWFAGGIIGGLMGLVAGQVAGAALNLALKIAILVLFIGASVLRIANLLSFLGG